MEVSAFNLPLTAGKLREAAFMSRWSSEDELPDAVMRSEQRRLLVAENHVDVRFDISFCDYQPEGVYDLYLSGIKLCVNYRMPSSSVVFLDKKGRAVGWITDIAVPKEGPDGIPKV